MGKKIVVTRNLGEETMSTLNSSGFEIVLNPKDAKADRDWLLKTIADDDVVAVCIQGGEKVDKEFLDAASKNLKVVSSMSVGFDHIDVKAANARGVKVGHTPGVLSDAVADICVMLTLMAMRNVEYGLQLIRQDGWGKLAGGPFTFCGPAIHAPNLTLGFLGFGRISEETLRRLLVFTNQKAPPKVIYLSSRERPNQKEIDANFSKQFGIDVRRASKEEIAKESDIITVLCNQTPDTTNMVNKEFLRMMKKSAVLVNGARGPIVNSEDLAEALKNNVIHGAGLDVITGEPNIGPDHPLVKLQNCVVIPHMGSADLDTRRAMADLSARNGIAGAKGESLPAEVKI